MEGFLYLAGAYVFGVISGVCYGYMRRKIIEKKVGQVKEAKKALK